LHLFFPSVLPASIPLPTFLSFLGVVSCATGLVRVLFFSFKSPSSISFSEPPRVTGRPMKQNGGAPSSFFYPVFWGFSSIPCLFFFQTRVLSPFSGFDTFCVSARHPSFFPWPPPRVFGLRCPCTVIIDAAVLASQCFFLKRISPFYTQASLH